MKEELRQDMHKDPAELEREADRARANVEHTLEALERRFSPGQVVDQVLQVVKDSGGDFGRNLSTQVRNNPLPVVLAGVGLAWLMTASDRPPRSAGASGSSLGQRASSAAGSARGAASAARGAAGHAAESTRAAAQTARSAVSSAADTARGALESATHGTRAAMGSMAGTTRETAQSMAYATRSGAQSLVQGYDYLRREQPLVLGALAVAAGALAGALFPSTAAEDEWLGEKSDETARRLKEEAGRKAEQAKAVAAEAAETAKGVAADAAEEVKRAAEPRRTGGDGGSAGASAAAAGTAGSGGAGRPPGASPGAGRSPE